MKTPAKPTPRQVLSENLKALMAARPDLGTIKKVAQASGSRLSNGKIGRIYAASHTTDIDALQHLAEVFGLQPWQLLVEGLKPEAAPVLIDQAVIDRLRQAVAAPVPDFYKQAARHEPPSKKAPKKSA